MFELKSAVAVLLLVLGIAVPYSAAQSDNAPPKELLQYVHEARRRGLADSKIKKQAIAVGWPAASVDEAITYDKNAKAQPDGSPAPATVTREVTAVRPTEPVMSQSATASSNPVQPMTPSAPTLDAPAAGAPAAAVPEKGGTPAVGAPSVAGASDDYLIGPGDTLQISVWKELELSVPTQVVRPDGRITMTLIKEVEVQGLTPRQAETVITARLAKYITDPNVTVVVTAFASKKVYLIGAVKKEGTLPYTYGMTVMQALSEAGGLTDYAKRDKIYVLRSEGGREYRLDFNYKEVVLGKRMEQNWVLMPGDTVVIPQ